MFTAAQLDAAEYTVRLEQETKIPLNVGTIEIGGGQWGPYLMTPVPPCGSLSGEESVIEGLKFHKHVPRQQYAIEYGPKGLPFTPDGNQTVLHEYGDGSL